MMQAGGRPDLSSVVGLSRNELNGAAGEGEDNWPDTMGELEAT